jgi:Fe-S-cluster containining protein
MTNKILKFLTLEDAINEVFLDLAVNPEKWYDLALFARVYGFLTKKNARPEKNRFNKPERVERGVWLKARSGKHEKFVKVSDFTKLVIDLIPKVVSKTDEIAQVYEWTNWVKVRPGKGADGADGICVETEMEKFHCTQCGNCCRNLYDAYSTTVDISDINRWRSEKRWDILRWVETYNFAGQSAFGDIWISPNTGDEVKRCPWLTKLRKQEKYKCRIQDTKPTHCRDYPKSKKHALTTGCRGFGDDSTFERVKLELNTIYDCI